MISNITKYRRLGSQATGLAAALLLVGCSREEVRTYQIAKAPEPAPPMPAGHPGPEAGGRPHLAWKTPADWEQVPPGEMRLASFAVKKDNQQADVSVIPLPGMAGTDLANVNRWRAQVGLEPVTEEELDKVAETVPMEGGSARLFDQGGQHPAANEKQRILAAILRRDGVAWFFKMTGHDELVAQQKPAFIEFLKSIHFHSAQEASHPPELPPSHPPIDNLPPPSGSATASGGAKPNWKVPAGWQEAAPGQFQMARFQTSGPEGGQAEVSVAAIPGDAGGELANVNRWRRQLGLSPIPEKDLPSSTTQLDLDGAKASVVDMTSEDKKTRMVVASVARAGATWFYKLMGDTGAVASQKEAFLEFVKSAQ